MNKRFARWMGGPGSRGKLVNIAALPKGSQSGPALRATRSALVRAIDADLKANPSQVDSSMYSRISGYSRGRIRVLASVRRQSLGLNVKGARGGARFRLPAEVDSIARKAISSARSRSGKTVLVKDILQRYAALSGQILLPSAIGHVVRRLDPKIKISYHGCSGTLKSLRSNPRYMEFRAYKKSGH